MITSINKNEIADLWNRLAERFNTHLPLGKIHPDAAVNIHVGWPVLFQQIEYQAKFLGVKKCKILDFGCGAGEFIKRLHKKGHSVVGIDHSENMLFAARKFLPKNIELVHGNHESPIFDDPKYHEGFDIITAVHSLEWIEDIETTFNNFAKVLRKGGIVLFAVFPKSHIVDSIKIKDLFEDFDSPTDPTVGYANFSGVRVPVYIRDASFFDKYFEGNGFQKILEVYPPYPKYFFREYNWSGSKEPEMMILSYRKL
ncbi:class I SAM-dependent methyltransferase [candidate division WWE3 bacterium]|uniref:Class I SAM-dependent methyltransferase n=1 Tax=candidate division WWE3 bacterium TaxID=2053526 RepID=A0A7X9DLC9_UNCKA|nr:class I SAM-dependent methyltransferase [candidate division WWE3 bacterium]